MHPSRRVRHRCHLRHAAHRHHAARAAAVITSVLGHCQWRPQHASPRRPRSCGRSQIGREEQGELAFRRVHLHRGDALRDRAAPRRVEMGRARGRNTRRAVDRETAQWPGPYAAGIPEATHRLPLHGPSGGRCGFPTCGHPALHQRSWWRRLRGASATRLGPCVATAPVASTVMRQLRCIALRCAAKIAHRRGTSLGAQSCVIH